MYNKFLLILVFSAMVIFPSCSSTNNYQSNRQLASDAEVSPLGIDLLTIEEEQKVHQSLLETFFPKEKISNNLELMAAYERVGAGVFSCLHSQMYFREAFSVFRSMGLDKGTATEREKRLSILSTQGPNYMRRVFRTIRLTYLGAIYGSPVGYALAGYPAYATSFVHPEAESYNKKKKFKLPTSSAIYDHEKKELTSKGKPFDVAIVGSGPAGSLIAYELTKAGLNVVLIDKGPLAIPGVMNTREFSAFKENSGIRTSVNGAIIFRNGSAVGGGASINIDLAFPPTLPAIQHRIENWRTQGLIEKNAFTSSQITKAYEYISKKVGTRKVTQSEVNTNNQMLWDGAIKLGRTPSLYDLNTFAPGKSPSPVNNKRSPVEAFLRPALENKTSPLVLLEETRVEKLETNGEQHVHKILLKKLTPSTLSNLVQDPHQFKISAQEEFTIEAKDVIVSSGTLGSAGILLKSEIQNENIGKGIVGHVSMPIMGVFDHPIEAWKGTDATVYDATSAISKGYILESMSADPSYLAMMVPGSREQVLSAILKYPNIAGFGVMLIDTPQPNNRVFLNEENSVEIDYHIDSQDGVRFTSAVADAVEIMFAAGAKQVILPTNEAILSPDDGRSSAVYINSVDEIKKIRENLKFIPNRTAVTSAHLQGSNKLSLNPEQGVVGPDFKVWGYDNLYVCDSSVFPSSIGANPMQSIYTFAKIFSDGFLAARAK